MLACADEDEGVGEWDLNEVGGLAPSVLAAFLRSMNFRAIGVAELSLSKTTIGGIGGILFDESFVIYELVVRERLWPEDILRLRGPRSSVTVASEDVEARSTPSIEPSLCLLAFDEVRDRMA